MRCLLCECLSWRLLCSGCLRSLLIPEFRIRLLEGNLPVHAAYGYGDLSLLLAHKYSQLGPEVYRQLAHYALRPYLRSLSLHGVFLLPLDDSPRRLYSHTAVLGRALKSRENPLLGRTLRATHPMRYAGASLHFRTTHPRNFCYTGPTGITVLLLDDVVTTGTTLKEAQDTLVRSGVSVCGALVLADARRD